MTYDSYRAIFLLSHHAAYMPAAAGARRALAVASAARKRIGMTISASA